MTMSISAFSRLIRLVVCGFIAVLCLNVPARGGETPGSPGSFGLFGGVNAGFLGGGFEEIGHHMAEFWEGTEGGTWTTSTEPRLGWGMGVYYLHNFSRNFGLQIEVQYIQRGGVIGFEATEVPDIGRIDFDATFKFNYVEIPVLARYQGDPENIVRPMFLFGPVLGMKESMSLEAQSEQDIEFQLVKTLEEKLVYGLLLAGGVVLGGGEMTSVVVQVRYYRTLTRSFGAFGQHPHSGDFGLFIGVELALHPSGQDKEPTSESDWLPR